MLDNLRQALGVWFIRKIQKYGPHNVRISGNNYKISEDVFNPKYYYTSKFMAKHIDIAPGNKVLDIGTGSGIQAITAAKKAQKVVAVDINPAAVRFARENVRANRLEDIVSVYEGDLFSPLSPEDRFDIIIFTPPYLEGATKTYFDRALFDNNKELAVRFFSEAKNHLKSDGYIQMVYSSIAKSEEVLRISYESGWRYTLIARKKLLFEEFFIYRMTLDQKEQI
jgi:release factor glutamine methyltransferase